MKIIHLSTEFAPIAKAGGLGDVLLGLLRRLSELKHDATIILPKYDFLPPLPLQKEISTFFCTENGVSYANKMWSAKVENCHLLLLEAFHPKNYFNRSKIYGEPDDVTRFLYFSKACLEYLKNQPLDVLHIHDWHTAAASILAKDLYNFKTRVIFTIHNAEYQGRCARWDLEAIDLKQDYSAKLHDDQYPDALNLLKGGIIYADAVNTVSPTYAQDVLNESAVGSISSTFRTYKEKLTGILNGIDQKMWNPYMDKHLPTHYSPRNKPANIINKKQLILNDLRKRFGLGENQRPWVGAITRLVYQKGLELLEQALYQTLELGGSFILLGSSPIPAIQHHFDHLKENYKNNNNVLFCFEYNEAFSHELYGALDFLVMPSLFEPCGLSQLIAMRYGTVPIVRKTGGLKDTVFDLDDETVPFENRNGFVFENPTKEDLHDALKRAFQFFRKKEDYQNLVKRIMKQDFGWEKPTEKYLKLYNNPTI